MISELHFLLKALFGEGILKMLTPLCLLEVEQPKIAQFPPGMMYKLGITRRKVQDIGKRYQQRRHLEFSVQIRKSRR